jgi:hypothetical protein
MAINVTKIKDETVRRALYELDAGLAGPSNPALGVATATSINKIALTAPATGATLTLIDGKTLTVSKTMTLTCADDTAVATLPAGATSLAPLVSPSFTTPALGTVASGVITACTGSPTLTAPVLGAATGTSVVVTGALTSSAGNVSALYADVSMGNALTAAGTDRATSLVLTKAINNITTAAASTGATLPSVATVGIGGFVIVFNAGANACQIYGAGSDTIDGVAAATGVPLTNAKRCVYIAVAAATWISAQLGVVSA